MDYSYGIIPLMHDGETPKVLLIQHNEGHRSFPKGHKENDETELQTARRELLEETGIPEIHLMDEIFFTEKYLMYGKDPKTVKYFLGFVEPEFAKNIKIQEAEINDFGRFNFADAHEKITHESAKNILDQVAELVNEE